VESKEQVKSSRGIRANILYPSNITAPFMVNMLSETILGGCESLMSGFQELYSLAINYCHTRITVIVVKSYRGEDRMHFKYGYLINTSR